ncbi:MAG: hypothetical protein JWO11_3923 [Nocardioides sp.]|nr:hypothetical protein [Nocardioides sp.]
MAERDRDVPTEESSGMRCFGCHRTLYWIVVPGEESTLAAPPDTEGCPYCDSAVALDDGFAKSFAVFAAVEEVLEKHLTSSRWKVSDNPDEADGDEANGWVRPARAALAELIEDSVSSRWDNDPTAAQADFEDFRDYLLWQAMVDIARADDGVSSNCACGGVAA